jgi:hypothetical protein
MRGPSGHRHRVDKRVDVHRRGMVARSTFHPQADIPKSAQTAKKYLWQLSRN